MNMDDMFEELRSSASPARSHDSDSEMREKIHMYMKDPEEFTCQVSMGYPRTAQKSYGRERRLLMCYPAVVLSGNGWRRRVIYTRSHCPTESCRTHHAPNNRYYEPSTNNRTFVSAEMMTTNGEVWRIPESLNLGTPAMAQLRIHDDREEVSVKATQLKLRLNYSGCFEIGVFNSKMITVVSKPHRSLQVVTQSHMSFKSGESITLSVRNTKLTRNLCIREGKIAADLPIYSTFNIYIVDENMQEGAEFRVIEDEAITYGSIVKLVDTKTNIGLPKMRILRSDERGVDMVTDPGISEVLHFQRAVFQFVDEPNLFLGLDDQDYQNVRPKMAKSQQFLNKHGQRTIDQAAIDSWLLIPNESITYTFAEMNGFADGPVSPVPLYEDYMEFAKGQFISVVGKNFTPRLQAWLDDIPLDTYYKNCESIIIRLPDHEERRESTRRLEAAGLISKATSELYFVRDDMVIYPSSFTFPSKE